MKKNNPPVKQPVYDSKSLVELLSESSATLVENPQSFKTKQKIKFICKCGTQHEKQYDSIKKNGALCGACSNKRKNERISQASKGVKRKINNPNPNQGVKRRKYTKTTLRALLNEYGASFVDETEISDKISTKTKVKFICKCGSTHEKQVRDFARCGALCKICTKKQKQKLISEKKTKILDPILNEETHKRCINCKNVYINIYFVHKQSEEVDTIWCNICRNKKKVHNDKLQQKRLISICDDPDKQKCTSCLMWRHKMFFENDNTTCTIVCRKSSRKSYIKWKARCKLFNKNNENIKKCYRCWKTYNVTDFLTDKFSIGVVCNKCRTSIINYNDLVADRYLQYKISNSICIDWIIYFSFNTFACLRYPFVFSFITACST